MPTRRKREGVAMNSRIRISIVVALMAVGLVGCGGEGAGDLQGGVTEGRIQAAEGVELYYRVTGAGFDTVVVLHGGAMGFPLDYLLPDLEPLASSHVLVFYDQRGAGRSTLLTDPERMSVEAHVADLDAVRRYFGLERMTLLGHSWGAGLAALYAAAWPDRVGRLVLVGPMPMRNAFMEEFGANLYGWMDSTTREELEVLEARMVAIATEPDPRATCRDFWTIFMRGYLGDPGDGGPLRRMRGDVCASPDAALRNSFLTRQLTFGALGDWDWRNDFGAVGVPVLVIHGSNEPIPMAAAEEWVAAFEDARLVVVDGAGHYPHVERPNAFFSAVEDFLR
jgi:proline iminopeptidase